MSTPDRPTVPRARPSPLAIAWALVLVAAIAGYVIVARSGWEPSDTEHDSIPVSVRTSPGGYRSFHFWHSGYEGGK